MPLTEDLCTFTFSIYGSFGCFPFDTFSYGELKG